MLPEIATALQMDQKVQEMPSCLMLSLSGLHLSGLPLYVLPQCGLPQSRPTEFLPFFAVAAWKTRHEYSYLPPMMIVVILMMR